MTDKPLTNAELEEILRPTHLPVSHTGLEESLARALLADRAAFKALLAIVDPAFHLNQYEEAAERIRGWEGMGLLATM